MQRPGLAGAGLGPVAVTPEEAERARRAGTAVVLQRAGQVVVGAAACRAVYGRLLRPRTLCTRDPDPGRNAHACAGDSGGPIVGAGAGGEPVLAGIVSWRGRDVAFAFRWTRRNRVVARTPTVALRRSGALQCTVTARTAGGAVARRAPLWRAR